MTLSHGRGPLSAIPAGWFTKPVPAGLGYVEPHPRRIVATRDGAAVIDTEQALLLHQPSLPLTYLFPVALLDGVPHEEVADAPGYARVPWDAVDEWREEGRVLVHYPPNPYHRVDCRPTRRQLRVEIGGTVLVDTDDTVILFETGLAAKLYVSPDHVRTDLLVRSSKVTYCNYKGYATYWSFVGAAGRVDDVAWTYEEPLAESYEIRHMLSFDADRVALRAALPASIDAPGSGEGQLVT